MKLVPGALERQLTPITQLPDENFEGIPIHPVQYIGDRIASLMVTTPSSRTYSFGDVFKFQIRSEFTILADDFRMSTKRYRRHDRPGDTGSCGGEEMNLVAHIFRVARCIIVPVALE